MCRENLFWIDHLDVFEEFRKVGVVRKREDFIDAVAVLGARFHAPASHYRGYPVFDVFQRLRSKSLRRGKDDVSREIGVGRNRIPIGCLEVVPILRPPNPNS